MKKTAVIWPYKFENFYPGISPQNSWERRFQWITKALQKEGYDIIQHPKFLCDIPDSIEYKGDRECDLVIYNHADMSEIKGDVIQAKKTWFFKPTVPDENQCTLDELGYGPFSSPTYKRPDLESIPAADVKKFFNTQVKKWKRDNSCKWGNDKFKKEKTTDRNFYLVLGQVFNDSVVTRHSWSNYFDQLIQVLQELNSWSEDKIIVKLHPYTNGKIFPLPEGDFDFIKDATEKIHKISNDIKVISDFTSVHSLLPHAKCVMLANSGCGFEAMMYKKPVISWAHPEYHWVTYDLRRRSDVFNAIKTKNWFDKDLSDRFLYWYMREYCIYDEASAERRVKELLKNE